MKTRPSEADRAIAEQARNAAPIAADPETVASGFVTVGVALHPSEWFDRDEGQAMQSRDSMILRGADHISAHRFRELCVECADGHCVFWECSDEPGEANTVERGIIEAARHPGPYRVSIANYGKRGDPRITSAQINGLRDRNIDAAELLMCADIPRSAIALLTGVPYWTVYRISNRLRKEDAASLGVDNADDECEKDLGVCTPEVRGEATDEAKEATA